MAVHTQLKQLRKESLENNSGLKEIEHGLFFFIIEWIALCGNAVSH